jgi:hypothetical protein
LTGPTRGYERFAETNERNGFTVASLNCVENEEAHHNYCQYIHVDFKERARVSKFRNQSKVF